MKKRPRTKRGLFYDFGFLEFAEFAIYCAKFFVKAVFGFV